MLTQKRHEEIVRRKVKSARRAAWMENKIRQQEKEIHSLKAKLKNMGNQIDELKEELSKKPKIKGYYINGINAIDCVTATAELKTDASTPEE